MNNKEYGYIKLYRSVLKDPDWYNGKKFDKGKAWIDLLLRANHKDKIVDSKDKKKHLLIKTGQVLTSQSDLANKWGGLSRNTIKNWLEDWEKVSNKLSYKTNRDIEHGNTIITITNWVAYQSKSKKSEQQTEHVQEYKRINTSKLFSNKEEEQSKYDKLYGLQVYDQVSPGSEVITYGN